MVTAAIPISFLLMSLRFIGYAVIEFFEKAEKGNA